MTGDHSEDYTGPFSLGQSSRSASASGEPTPNNDQSLKKRKVIRACDVCRRKKIRCDGPMNSNSKSKCANCQEYGYECTYVETAKRRGPPKGYVETLEQRCGRLESLLHQLHPDLDYNLHAGPPLSRDDFDISSYQDSLKSLNIPPWPQFKTAKSALPAARAPSPPYGSMTEPPWKTHEADPDRRPPSPTHEDASIHVAIAQAMKKLDIKENTWRFHGKASPHYLIMTFNELRRAVSGRNMIEGIKANKRSEYWQVPEWEIVIANEGLNELDMTVWPPSGLDQALIDAYFQHVNLHLPLLNKILFEKQYRSEMYKTNHDFAKVCLMVFANGSRFVDDDRVYWPVDDALTAEGRERLASDKDGTLRYSAGWKYLRAVIRLGRSMMDGPSLLDFQTQVLVCSFLHGSAVPHLTWIVSGLGLRAAQEIGIHMRSILSKADPVERALFQRSWWALYHTDRVNCAAIGRSVAIQDSDFDAEYPIEVDDEYWETDDPTQNFIQPEEAGVSYISAFVQTLKLDHIIGAALRTLYAINKPADSPEGEASQRAAVIELDSALNAWADAVPDGLRWDPTRSNNRLFQQSAVLYVQYYYCQILIHRQFMSKTERSTSGLPALAICANASRSICSITDTALRRGRQSGLLPGRILSVQFMLPCWIAAIILLISIYTGKQQKSERERAVADVHKCLAAIKELELTWRQAGKLTDVLTEFAGEIDDIKYGKNGLSVGKKRTRDDQEKKENGGTEKEKVNVPPPLSPQVPFEQTMGPMEESLFDMTFFDNMLLQFGDANGSREATGDGDMWSQMYPLDR